MREAFEDVFVLSQQYRIHEKEHRHKTQIIPLMSIGQFSTEAHITE